MPPARRPLEERFWPKVDRRGPDECWPWLGSPTDAGYGVIGAGGKYGPNVYAHRLAYELLVGPIPDGLVIDHTCETPSCVNPAHLEPVTLAVNVIRSPRSLTGANVRKTHCDHGHSLDGAYVDRRGRRHCRQCRARRLREMRARRKAAA